MNLLTPDSSVTHTDHSVTTPIRMVSIHAPAVRPRRASKWLIIFGIAAAFVSGFGLSTYWRPPNLQIEPKLQIARLSCRGA